MVTTSAAPAQTAPPIPEHVERVLRLAARSLPGVLALRRSPVELSALAADLRKSRVYYVHDAETAAGIDAWLRAYRGER